MLTLFFTIIFIAEVIITVQLIALIIKLDKKVLAINQIILGYTPKLKDALYTIRIGVNKALLGVYNLKDKIEKQKARARYKIIKNIITILLFLILNPKGKYTLSTVDILLSIKDYLKNKKQGKAV